MLEAALQRVAEIVMAVLMSSSMNGTGRSKHERGATNVMNNSRFQTGVFGCEGGEEFLRGGV